ncbi:MAG: SLBB domain-containing protein, partial [Woeseiaceae bacterium]
QWRRGMRLTDLISSSRELEPGADSNYILIRRENPVNRSISVVSANLQMALDSSSSAENVLLQERDQIHVFSLAHGRQRVIEPIMEVLRLQARHGLPNSEVRIDGHVRSAGRYPLEPNMRISDLIRAGGNLKEGAYTLDAELTRFEIVNNEYRAKEIIDVDLVGVLNGDTSADLVLSAHDHLTLSWLPDWASDWSVTLEGEVKFPGVYQVRRGEKLGDVIDRAGGLTDHAFPEGAIFLRESLKEREREQIEVLIKRMETDLAALSLETLDTTGVEALSTGQALLDQLRETEPVGRLVIDVSIRGRGKSRTDLVSDLELKDGDRLLLPTKSQEVTVLGEAQYTTSHLFRPGLSRDDYIALSGGLTRKADKKQIYIVRASGAVIAENKSKWFGRRGDVEIRPGDTIVIPLDTDRIRPLTFWTGVTQILYQGAIAVAAVQTFGN